MTVVMTVMMLMMMIVFFVLLRNWMFAVTTSYMYLLKTGLRTEYSVGRLFVGNLDWKLNGAFTHFLETRVRIV